MLVKERMSHPAIMIKPDMPIMEALDLFRREKIRRAPVIQDGKMVGIVSDKDLLNASPSSATSLSVWELNYLVSRIKVQDVMTKKVLTVDENTPIEEAARVMADNKIGGLPVMRDGHVVGIITETDLFKVFLELMGARESGVRVTALMREQKGELGILGKAIAEAGGSFISFGLYAGEDQTNRSATFKVIDMPLEKVKAVVEPLVLKVLDIR